MDVGTSNSTTNSANQNEEEMIMDLRRGPWTVEEDLALINYIATHGEGRWNSLARCAGLKRTGKSCRLRWLNYLRPDVRRGNITLEEQLIILELHSRWGNRWSKIAQHLPGRTDNEIKNYWRTRVQKHAKQLQCDVNSKQFKDTMRYLWMPRLVERIQAAAAASGNSSHTHNYNQEMGQLLPSGSTNDFRGAQVNQTFTPDNSSTGGSSESHGDFKDYYNSYQGSNNNIQNAQIGQGTYQECQATSTCYTNQEMGFHGVEQQNMWLGGDDSLENSWNVDDLWILQQQFNHGI